MKRAVPLVTGQYYHIFTKCVEGIKIFGNDRDFRRMLNLIRFYQLKNTPMKYSYLDNAHKLFRQEWDDDLEILLRQGEKQVVILAYCLMSNHFHLLIRQSQDGGISAFMANVLNSYARYFNIKNERKGPVWIGRFKNVLIESEQQLLHTSRYIHLNPTTAKLVQRPEDWKYSSYRQYINLSREKDVCTYKDVINLSSREYKDFTEDNVAHQRELAELRHLSFD